MKSPRGIAIVGAGLCGLATAFYLRNATSEKITLIDPQVPGAAPHRIDAGLMHPFPGPRARKAPDFEICRAETLKLLQTAQRESSEPIYRACGLFRLAGTDQRREDFRRAANERGGLYPVCLAELLGGGSRWSGHCEGLWIASAIAVNIPLYTQALWRNLQQRAVELAKEPAMSLAELLRGYDQVILANGFGAQQLLGERCPPLRPLRGQWFVYRANTECDELPVALENHFYALPIPGLGARIFAGATFERTDELFARSDEKISQLERATRGLINAEQLVKERCGVAIRCAAPDHLPVARWIDERVGIITAMGAKGLTRHAICARQLAEHRL